MSRPENRFLQLLLFLTVFLCVKCQYWLNCSQQTEEKCVSRYDAFAAVTKSKENRKHFNYSQCDPREIWYCMCKNSSVTFLYFEMPPYIHRDKDRTVEGLIPAVLQLVYTVCCSGCTKIIYRDPLKSLVELTHLFFNYSYYDALFPVLADVNAVSVFGSPFVKLFPTPGVYYIEIDRQSELVMGKLVSSLLSNWPLFVIALLLTLHGGVIIWMLDSFRNPDEFPPSLVSGITEGSWWAYISMTTVGYGDKSPKSLIGRAFSVIWIAIGISICGIFTASLTSAMTSAAIAEKTNLDGKKVGVLDHGVLKYETNIIHRDGGIPVEYQNVSSLREALKGGRISGILMDKMVLRHYWNDLKKIGLQLLVRDDIENSDTAVGVQFRSPVWANFLREFFISNKDASLRMQNDVIKDLKHKIPNPDLPKPVTTSPFSSPVIYKKLIYYIGFSCLVTVAIGCLFELCKRLRRSKLLAKNKAITTNTRAEIGVLQDEGEKTRKLESMRRRIEESVLKEIREEFEMLKLEMNKNDNLSH